MPLEKKQALLQYFPAVCIFGVKMRSHFKHVAIALLFLSSFAVSHAQVILSPVGRQTFFDQAGNILSYGCVFTYASGTTTPIPSFTDGSGNTQNSNPIKLTAGGYTPQGLWLTAGTSYTLKVMSYDGSSDNCATGGQVYTVNGVGGGGAQLLTVVPFSTSPQFTDIAQNQMFQLTLTGNAVSLPLTVVGVTPPSFIAFQIIQDSVGGHSFVWPSGVVGGTPFNSTNGTETAGAITAQLFEWNGTEAISVGPATIINGSTVSFGDIAFDNITANNLTLTGELIANEVSATASIFSGGSISADGTVSGGILAGSSGNISGNFTVNGTNTYATEATVTKCNNVGTSASPSIVSCGSAAAGSFSCAVAASGTTCQVNDTAVTSTSEIFVQPTPANAALLGVTCNTSFSGTPTQWVSSKTLGVGFVIFMPTITSNPACFDFRVTN